MPGCKPGVKGLDAEILPDGVGHIVPEKLRLLMPAHLGADMLHDVRLAQQPEHIQPDCGYQPPVAVRADYIKD